jgi:uncharacterized coiled-coil protein SlyX
MALPLLLFVDADGKLGTMPVDHNGNKLTAPGLPDANPPLAVPARQAPTTKDAHQAILNHKVEELQATVACQQAQIDALTAGLQKVSAELEVRKPAAKTVANK